MPHFNVYRRLHSGGVDYLGSIEANTFVEAYERLCDFIKDVLGPDPRTVPGFMKREQGFAEIRLRTCSIVMLNSYEEKAEQEILQKLIMQLVL